MQPLSTVRLDLQAAWDDFCAAGWECAAGGPDARGGSVTFRMPRVEWTTEGRTYQFGGDRTFRSVADYECSACWRLVRGTWIRRYEDEHGGPPCCLICRKPSPLELHHLGYAALGFDDRWEILDELVPLCTWHHYELEKRIRTGVLKRATAHQVFLAVKPRRAGPRAELAGEDVEPEF